MKFSRLHILIPLLAASLHIGLGQETIPVKEYHQRRQNLMARLLHESIDSQSRRPDGIVLLHARNIFANEGELTSHGFQQNPGFFYFTGLAKAVNAILALDCAKNESWLFVPSDSDGVHKLMPAASITPGKEAEARWRIDHIVRWDELASFLDGRQQQGRLVLYVDDSYWIQPPRSNPPGLQPISDTPLLWRNALATRWPSASIRSAREVIAGLRATKSPAEIQIIRRVAGASAAALLAGLRSIAPNKSQREVEAEIVCGCIRAGAEGPSFWPWVISGPNAVFPKPFESLVDYYHLNRRMEAGELVRVDVGCDLDFYKGDVGRTAPVSGRFTADQREVWNLLVEAYRAGIAAIRPGARHEDIIVACRRAVESERPRLRTSLGKEAATMLLDPNNRSVWHLHTSGLEPGEKAPVDVFTAGMVLEFEPMLALSGQAFYLEDMVLVTETGCEILTAGLPYTADEIEKTMSGNR